MPESIRQDAVTVGEVGRWLARVDKNLAELSDEIRTQRSEYVHRSEWDAHRAEVARRMAATEADLGARTHVDHAERMWKSLHDHEGRLRSIEQKVWTAAGVASLMGAGLGVLFDTIISYTQ